MTTLLACGYHLSDASDAMQASLIAIASILFETNQPIGSKKPTSERFGEILSILDKEKSKFMNMVFDFSILYLDANSIDLHQGLYGVLIINLRTGFWQGRKEKFGDWETEECEKRSWHVRSALGD